MRSANDAPLGNVQQGTTMARDADSTPYIVYCTLTRTAAVMHGDEILLCLPGTYGGETEATIVAKTMVKEVQALQHHSGDWKEKTNPRACADGASPSEKQYRAAS